MNQHVTTEQILDYLDGCSDRGTIDRHIEACPECSTLVAEFRLIDSTLRQLPLLKTGPGLTGRVMERVLKPAADSLSYRLLTMLAYLAPMTIVLVILGAVFSLTGVINLQGENPGSARSQGLVDLVSRVSQDASSLLISLLRDYAPFMAHGESVGISLAILIILTMLAVIDRVVGARVGGEIR